MIRLIAFHFGEPIAWWPQFFQRLEANPLLSMVQRRAASGLVRHGQAGQFHWPTQGKVWCEMTAIAGAILNGQIAIGGDSASVGGLSLSVVKQPKVFHSGEFLIGATTSWRMIQLLQFSDIDAIDLRKHDDTDPFEIMVKKFVPWCRTIFKDGGFLTKDREADIGGTFLVGFRGRLFRVDSDFQVAEPEDNYSAVGCGADICLGAMHARQWPCVPSNVSATDIVEAALHAAERFSAGVRGPFKILTQGVPCESL